MKKTLQLYSLACLLATTPLAHAQVGIANETVRKAKQNVVIGFDLTSGPRAVRSNHKLILLPYLFHGPDTLFLSPIEIYGKAHYKRERQQQTLAGNRQWRLSLSANQVLKGTPISYSAQIPYEKWMRTASLGIETHTVGCGRSAGGTHKTLLAQTPVYTPPVPYTAEVTPDPAKYTVIGADQCYSFDSSELRVFFPVGRNRLDTASYGNGKTLDEIMTGIRQIIRSGNQRLDRIQITGSASPEGRLALNTQLGSARAKALRNYIRQKEPVLRDENFELINGREDWDGLRRMVAASDMEHRRDVLRLIDTPDLADRKARLQALAGGAPYAYMLRTFYPELRTACYIAVYYDRLGDPAADQINAANRMIRQGQYREALEALRPHSDDSRTWNSIGVCHMMLEEEQTAITWFEKAAAAADSNALRNLEQLK